MATKRKEEVRKEIGDTITDPSTSKVYARGKFLGKVSVLKTFIFKKLAYS